MVTQIDGGGSGKLAGRVLLPGTACIVDGEGLRFHGHGTNSGELLARRLCTKQREKGGV